MSELQIFKNAEFGSVRTITVEGEPYFVGYGAKSKSMAKSKCLG